MFKRRNRAWVAVLLAGALVAGLTTQAFATPVAPDRPTGLTAVLDDGGVLLSWDAPDETVDSWQVLRRIRPAETAHTVVATVDGELNEWTDTDLTAGDRRYKVVAVRDSLTSRRSRVRKAGARRTPSPVEADAGHHHLRPREGALDREGTRGCVFPCCEHCHCRARRRRRTSPAARTGCRSRSGLSALAEYQIYVDKTEGGTARIDFVCGPDQTEIGDTTAAPRHRTGQQ